MIYDCAIVGGGPAGLNAALVLGRARRSVLLLDSGNPRNAVTHASHGFITRDGVRPAEFRRLAHEELLRYPSIRMTATQVTGIEPEAGGFAILASSGERMQARKVILAAGLREELPDIEGIRQFYGSSLFNCPFCDGWELRDQPLVIISDNGHAFHVAKLLLGWTQDIIVCTNGRSDTVNDEQRKQLEARGVRVVDLPVASLGGQQGQLERVIFADGSSIERSGGFVAPNLQPNAMFHAALGYRTLESGGIAVDEMGRTDAAGVYAAGDSAYVMPSQVVYAAASGSKAAMAVVADLTEEDWQA